MFSFSTGAEVTWSFPKGNMQIGEISIQVGIGPLLLGIIYGGYNYGRENIKNKCLKMTKHLIKNSILREHMSAIIFFSICILFAISSILWTKSEFKRLENEFPRVCLNDSLDDYIIKVKREYKSMIRVPVNRVDLILKNNRKISIQANLNDSTGEGIYKTLESNDLIRKRRGSDTLYIYKKNSNIKHYDYYFRLDLNE